MPKGICKTCGREGNLISGFCTIHYWASRKKISNEKIKSRDEKEKEDLDRWFLEIEKTIRKNPVCWETSERISESDFRAATAHIMPKSIFVSVSTHPLNFLILSPRNGSHDKTHRLDTFCRMKIFTEACIRFRIFEPLIREKHKYLENFRNLVDEHMKNQNLSLKSRGKFQSLEQNHCGGSEKTESGNLVL